jgi:hypothetical protein
MVSFFQILFFSSPILWILNYFCLKNWSKKGFYFGLNFLIIILYSLYLLKENPLNANFDSLAQFVLLMFIFIIHSFLSFIFGIIFKFKFNRNAN